MDFKSVVIVVLSIVVACMVKAVVSLNRESFKTSVEVGRDLIRLDHRITDVRKLLDGSDHTIRVHKHEDGGWFAERGDKCTTIYKTPVEAIVVFVAEQRGEKLAEKAKELVAKV